MCEKWDFNRESAEIDYEGLKTHLGAKAIELLRHIPDKISAKPLADLTGPRHIGAYYAAKLLGEDPEDDTSNSHNDGRLESLAEV